MNLKELSKKLGLSQTTVSRALNGFPEVKAETRERVAAAARQYNYSPNARAKGLATGKSYSIGHIIPLSTRSELVNPVFTDFIAGAGETYSRRGYDLTLSVVRDEDEEQAYRDMAAKNKVDGIIVHGPKTNDPRIDLLKSIGLPFVVHGRGANTDVDYCWVDVNNKSAFRRATEFLIDLGHRRLALVNGDETMHFAARRRMGFEEAHTARGLDVDPALIRGQHMTEDFGYRFTHSLMETARPPTGFVVSSMLMAIGVRRALQELGLELGRDASLITHDDDLSYLPNSGDVPMFTATQSSVRQAGQRCAEMLLDLIAGEISAPQHDLWEAQLIVGASTGPMLRQNDPLSRPHLA